MTFVPGKAHLEWVAHRELSAAHASFVVATGAPCADERAEQLLVGPVTDVNNRLLSSAVEIGTFWRQYLSEIIRGDPIPLCCSRALAAAGCNELLIEQTTKAVSSQLNDARRSFQERFPKLEEQLDLRARPLRTRWETIGPQLLDEVERQIWKNSPPPDWWPDPIRVLLVQPARGASATERGGDGDIDTSESVVWIEAVLNDIDPQIPEVLRVGWLVTRLAIDKHTRERSSVQRLSRSWSLASIPLVLTAAVDSNVLDRQELPVESAMTLWHFGSPTLAEILLGWWDDFEISSSPLPVALGELEKQLRLHSREA